MNKYRVVCLFIFCSTYVSLIGQSSSASSKVNVSVPDVALVNVVSNQPAVQFNPKVSNSTDAIFHHSESNSELWINYSSVSGSQRKRAVMVAIGEGELPKGLNLYVTANHAVSGKGEIGKPAGKIKLNHQPSVLIENIGTAYTESGVNRGHRLNYEWAFDESNESVQALNYDKKNDLKITYTIMDM